MEEDEEQRERRHRGEREESQAAPGAGAPETEHVGGCEDEHRDRRECRPVHRQDDLRDQQETEEQDAHQRSSPEDALDGEQEERETERHENVHPRPAGEANGREGVDRPCDRAGERVARPAEDEDGHGERAEDEHRQGEHVIGRDHVRNGEADERVERPQP